MVLVPGRHLQQPVFHGYVAAGGAIKKGEKGAFLIIALIAFGFAELETPATMYKLRRSFSRLPNLPVKAGFVYRSDTWCCRQ
jgi:hypothetical protein